MWMSESFRSLDLLLGYANERRLPIERAKVVVSREAGGSERFHLLYEPVEESERVLAAVATAEIELADEVAPEEVLDEAEAIIHDAQRDA